MATVVAADQMARTDAPTTLGTTSHRSHRIDLMSHLLNDINNIARVEVEVETQVSPLLLLLARRHDATLRLRISWSLRLG